jgi:sugar/nucleoside kinase (ribokinase family)
LDNYQAFISLGDNSMTETFPLPHPDRQLVVGIGSALVDILIDADDAFIGTTGVPKGGMVYFDSDTIDETLTASGADPIIVPGGAACNTMVGIGKLGGLSRFIGKRGNDRYGQFFEDSLTTSNVEPMLMRTATPTGKVLSVISPDSQRTMLTCLGAAAEITQHDLHLNSFADAAVTLVEGYLVYNPELFEHALKRARKAQSLIALDLSSFTVVEECMANFDAAVRNYVDILIANEEEARAFTGAADDDSALDELAKRASLAVLKLGPRGSRVAWNNHRFDIPAAGSHGIVDTTGAGDLWAAGFLFGLVNALPLDQCGHIASACGYEVCRVKGAAIPEDGWRRIWALLDPAVGSDRFLKVSETPHR